MPTLEQVFQQEKAWIAECDDVDALIEKIGDWRESLRVAERDGEQLVRMRAGDLIGLARRRVVRLSSSVIRAEAARAAPAKQVAAKVVESRVEPRVVEPVRAPEPAARRPEPESRPAQRKVDEEAVRAAAEKLKADARIAAAEADKIELQNKLLRAQVVAAQRAASPQTAPTTAAKAAKARTPERAVQTKVVAANGGPSPTTTAATRQPAPARARAPQTKPAAVPLNDNDGYTEADRLALASVGHWPPTPPSHRGAFWSKHDDWPRDWTLTGGDVGRFRGEINLTRAVFAAQLGVPSAVVKDAELNPRERVGPSLQIAIRRAMDHEIQARRVRRDARAAAAQAPREPVAAVLPSVPAPVVVAQAASNAPQAFTGADLAGIRTERRLSQREMADLLGVEQGTISKGEGKAGAALGPALQEALGRLAAGGGAGGAGVMPE